MLSAPLRDFFDARQAVLVGRNRRQARLTPARAEPAPNRDQGPVAEEVLDQIGLVLIVQKVLAICFRV
jgi:hypothetical protein